jgi:tetratricopeptide (TPR) repeat protein
MINSYPQQRNLEQNLRTAQSFEQMQDWENAVKFYENLYKTDSINIVFFDGLLRGYDQLKKYDDAIRIINTQLRYRQKDIGLLSQLGKMYARGSNTDRAIEAWNNALDVDKKNAYAYTIVANAMIESRMIEEAIKVYKKGRSVIGDPYLFASDLGYLYSMFMNFAEATKEYLLLLKQSPVQLGFVQSRMSLYTGKSDGLSGATSVVEESQKSEPHNVALMQLLAWLYMEGKNYDKAYTIYKSLDEKSKAGGREIFNFAERAFRDKAYHSAAKAYSDIISNYKNFPNIPAAKYSYARTIEEAATEQDTLKLFGELKPFKLATQLAEINTSYNDAIDAYNKVINESPNTEFAGRSLLRIAYIQFHNFFDLEKSLEVLAKVESNYKSNIQISIEATLMTGNVLIARGDLDKAAGKFKWLVDNRSSSPDIRDKANFELAEIDFYNSNFTDALNRLQALTKNPTSEIANDALSLQILIKENEAEKNVLQLFSKASLLKRQRQFDKAIESLQGLAKSYPKSELTSDALVDIGDIYSTVNKFTDAVVSYEKLINDFPESINLDKSQIKIAQVFQFGLKDNNKATAAYQKLLEKFPGSVYVNEARRRIRELRGENL